jgi:hypothetical protein
MQIVFLVLYAGHNIPFTYSEPWLALELLKFNSTLYRFVADVSGIVWFRLFVTVNTVERFFFKTFNINGNGWDLTLVV